MTKRRANMRRLPQPRRAKLTTGQRGYGLAHKRMREKWRKVVESGQATCTRCGTAIHPGARWHLDHTDDRTGYLGAAHAGCNVSAAQRRRYGLPPLTTQPISRTRPKALGMFDTGSDQQEPPSRPPALNFFNTNADDAESSSAPVDLDAE